MAATTEAIEMPYVLTSTVKLVDKDPANISDTAEAVTSYQFTRHTAHGTRKHGLKPLMMTEQPLSVLMAYPPPMIQLSF